MTTERIDGTWLVEDRNEHTCGAGPGSGAGHEPGCGEVPLVDLRGIQGWDTLVAHIHQFEPAPAGVIDREAIARAAWTSYDGEQSWDELCALAEQKPDGDYADIRDGYLGEADRILTILPGRTVAQVKAEAWDEGVRAAADYLIREAVEARTKTGVGTVMFDDTKPCRDAIDASPSRLSSSQYIAHLRWANLGGASQDVADMTTDLDDDDKPLNPYRADELEREDKR